MLPQLNSIEAEILELESQANYYYDFGPWNKVFLDSAIPIAKRAGLDSEVPLTTFQNLLIIGSIEKSW